MIHHLNSLFPNKSPIVYSLSNKAVSPKHLYLGNSSNVAVSSALLLEGEVETLLRAEQESICQLHTEISKESNLDSIAIWEATTFQKKCLYLSFPVVALDPISTPIFRRNEINGRVFLVNGDSHATSVRLEAICTFRYATTWLRYALAIQYKKDKKGNPWQVLRPAILINPNMIDAARNSGCEDDLLYALQLLVILASQGNHDYLHGTMMRWFSPPKFSCEEEYRVLMTERATPPHMLEWEATLDGTKSCPLQDGIPVPVSDPLEFWSLISHAKIMQKIFAKQPAALDAISQTFENLIQHLDRTRCRAARQELAGAASLLSGLGAFFFQLLVPNISVAGIAVQGTPAKEALGFARNVHGALIDRLGAMSFDQYRWNGNTIELFNVLEQYSNAINAGLSKNSSPCVAI